MAEADKDKKPEEKDVFKALIGKAASIVLKVLSGFEDLSLDEIVDDVDGTLADIKYGLCHRGAVLANIFGLALWAGPVWLMVANLVFGAWIGEGMFLASWKSILCVLVFEACRGLLTTRALTVSNVGFREHRDLRKALDQVAREVKRLDSLVKQGLRGPGDNNIVLLNEARTEHARRQLAYNEFIRRNGPGRSPWLVLMGHNMLAILSGFALVYGMVGRHVDGTYTYHEILWYVIEGCFLPWPIFLLPDAFCILAAPFLFNRFANVEDIAIFLRLEAKAAADLGRKFAEIEAQHKADSRDNGDQPHRNSSLVAKQHGIEFMASMGLKVIIAEGLFVQHALLFPSGVAFVWSVFFSAASWFTEKVLEKHNILKEDHRRWPSRVLSVIAYAGYVHMFFAGGAPAGYRGPGWWWSPYGPFSSHNREVAANDTAVVTTPVGEHVHQVWTMNTFGAIVFALMIAGIIYLLVRYGQKVGEHFKKIEPAPLRKGVGWVGGIGAAWILFVAFKLLFQAPAGINEVTRDEATTEQSTATTSTTTNNDVQSRPTGNLDVDCRPQPGRAKMFCMPPCFEFWGMRHSAADMQAARDNDMCVPIPSQSR